MTVSQVDSRPQLFIPSSRRMSALVTLPALAVDAIVCFLTFLDHRDLLFLCKSMRDSAWHEVILSNQRLAFPPELQDARACMAVMQPLIRSYFTAFRLADTDVLGDLIQAFPRVRRLKISTQEVKWGTSGRNERKVTLDTQRLSPLTQSLVYLDLSRSGVSDLRPLAQLVLLEELNLSRNDSLRSLDPLQALVRVRVLDVSHTYVSQITCVSAMQALASLDISDTRVDTLAPLSELQHLHTVKIRQNRTNTIALEDLCNSLRVLELGSAMTTLTFNHLQKLQKLEVYWVDQPMIQAISTLVNLQELEIGQITYGVTISSLGSLIQLRVLRVMVNSVAEVALLRSLRHLKELVIRAQEYRSQSRDFEFFGNFPALEKLEYVCADALSTNSDSIACTGLQSLILNCNQARFGLNQGPAQIPLVIPENLLRRNPDLRLLEIQENYRDILQSLEELAAVPQLLELHLELALPRYKRPRGFWCPLEALVNLRRLTLVHARLPDFTPFRAMTRLEVIALKHGQFSSFSGIEALVSLEVLDLGTSILPDITPLRCLTLLRRLTLPKGVDCSPVVNGELPRLVELFHPRQNCLGMTPAPTRYSLRHPRKRCRE